MVSHSSFAATRTAIAVLFFVNGFGFATWVSRIPAVRDDLSLTEGQLGTALFGLAAGALVAFPLAGRVISARGARLVTVLSALAYCISLPGPALAGGLGLLIVSLFVFGLANGAMDVSMNALAVDIEILIGKPIMSSLHGMWSAGGFAGAVTGSFFAKQGVAPDVHLVVAAAVLLTTSIVMNRWLPASRVAPVQSSPHFVRPEAAMIGLGIIIFCSFLIEGAMADWSAVLLRDDFATSEATAALGYAAFSLAMMGMRFVGDRVITRWNATMLLRSTNTVGAIAFGAALWFQNVGFMLVALALVGFGTATVAPLVFREAGKRSHSGAGRGIAAMATVGYGGFLVGPPFVGWIAEATTLRMALSLLVLLALTIVMLAHHLRESS